MAQFYSSRSFDHGRRLDFHALRYTFATKLAREGVAQRTAQELMRHSDPKLTAMIYTDPTQLPTFDCVEKLPWPELKTASNGQNPPQIHPQSLCVEGHQPSQRGTCHSVDNIAQDIEIEPLSHCLSQPGSNDKMVL